MQLIARTFCWVFSAMKSDRILEDKAWLCWLSHKCGEVLTPVLGWLWKSMRWRLPWRLLFFLNTALLREKWKMCGQVALVKGLLLLCVWNLRDTLHRKSLNYENKFSWRGHPIASETNFHFFSSCFSLLSYTKMATSSLLSSPKVSPSPTVKVKIEKNPPTSSRRWEKRQKETLQNPGFHSFSARYWRHSLQYRLCLSRYWRWSWWYIKQQCRKIKR